MLKMDENNQYGNAMTKPLPYDCIKKASKVPSLLEFNMILDSISETDKVGHLFIVDIKFNDKNEKTMLFNEIYTPIFEKKKRLFKHIKDLSFSLCQSLIGMEKKIWSGFLKQMLKFI